MLLKKKEQIVVWKDVCNSRGGGTEFRGRDHEIDPGLLRNYRKAKSQVLYGISL